jgi:peptide/nickel transport system permease protein
VTTPAYVLSTAIAIYVALFSALYHNRWIDRALVVACVALMSVPFLAIIIIAQYGVCYYFDWFPVAGYAHGWEALKFVALPVLLGTIVGVGGAARFYRTVMLEEIRQDYVRTARAKGLERGVVLFKHVLKNAMIPILTNVVVTLPLLYTGSLLLEQFFGIPGLGRTSVTAINAGDRPVLLGMVLVGSFIYVLANLAADLCYAVADPRVRLR